MAIETTSDLSLVGTSQIVDGSVTSAKIAAGAVGTAAISSGAATSGQILQADGSGAVSFATPAGGGGMTLIATATPSAATSLAFSSIPGTYKHLMLIWRDVFQSTAADTWTVLLNNDSAANYQTSVFRMTSASASGVISSTENAVGRGVGDSVINGCDTVASESNSRGVLWVYRYAETEAKLVTWDSRSYKSAATAIAYYANGQVKYTGTTAITSLNFKRSSTQTITGTFYLYGVS
jgi:hypothetical protein